MMRLASLSSIRKLPRCIQRQRGSGVNLFLYRRSKSSVATASDEQDFLVDESSSSSKINAEIQRLRRIRNVGVFAHVDAGKTTVTERMLALAGVVGRAGSVDDGDTVTDYLPAERERGITIQSAAISFDWGWHNNRSGDDANDKVTISLIDTPGHVDFSVEVNRSVAVLDGAVLVVDAVAGCQAQTETVWRAMTRPSLNNHDLESAEVNLVDPLQDHAHEPLPCLALINKMDKDGCHFGSAIDSLREKLPGANPVAMHLPLFRSRSKIQSGSRFPYCLHAPPIDSPGDGGIGEFVGVVDLVHMRAVLWPDTSSVSDVEECVPHVIPLLEPHSFAPVEADCPITQEALNARASLIEQIADFDEQIEDYYLKEEQPSNNELRVALRRGTLAQKALPVMAGAALRGMGVEPVLDSIADLLPSPLDRKPPALINLDSTEPSTFPSVGQDPVKVSLGHPLHPSGLLALAFKVVHMKGRGGSGDGRVVFARVYSGELRERASVHVVAPAPPGEKPEKPRLERIGGMLELAGGRFGNSEDGICRSGNVCALVGLKSVTTGDTLVVVPDRSKNKKKQKEDTSVCLAGVASPKPVLKVRLEAETTAEQTRLSELLTLFSVEDPSLVVEETESSTLLSGLGELHLEVVLDRLRREYGLVVHVGEPSVAYRETVIDNIETEGLCDYDRTVGGTRMQASVHLLLKPTWKDSVASESSCMMLSEPVVSVSENVRDFFDLDLSIADEELMLRSEVFKALVQGCQGALKRGPLGAFGMANLNCHVLEVDAEEGLAGLQAMPGALRAAAANAVSTVLSQNQMQCTVLEPTVSIEISLANDKVGTVLSDLTSRRGNVGDVIVAENQGLAVPKALVRGEVPLAQILGYASVLRSLTGGEGSFTAEYKGHAPFGVV